MEGWAPVRLYVCVLARRLPLRALRRRAGQVGTQGWRSGEASSRGVANVQSGGESSVGGSGWQICVEVCLERPARSGDLFGVLSAGVLSLRGVRRSAVTGWRGKADSAISTMKIHIRL